MTITFAQLAELVALAVAVSVALVLVLLGAMPGGLPPPRPDQGYAPTNPPMAAGSTPVVRARQVIVSGPNEGVFSYSPSLGAGNLIATAGIAMAGADEFGNNYLIGTSTYAGSFATSLNAGFINFYTGSLAAGWTFQANIQISGTGELILEAANTLVSDNLEVGSNLQVDGTMTVGGSADTGTPSPNSTSTNGLTSGVINGTSGAQSAGTAHTHGPGSYAVANGTHNHDLQNHDHPF